MVYGCFAFAMFRVVINCVSSIRNLLRNVTMQACMRHVVAFVLVFMFILSVPAVGIDLLKKSGALFIDSITIYAGG